MPLIESKMKIKKERKRVKSASPSAAGVARHSPNAVNEIYWPWSLSKRNIKIRKKKEGGREELGKFQFRSVAWRWLASLLFRRFVSNVRRSPSREKSPLIHA
jgi:hypothetical protein